MTKFTSVQGVLEINALKREDGVSLVKDAKAERSKGKKWIAHKVKTGGFKRESVAKERLFHQTLK